MITTRAKFECQRIEEMRYQGGQQTKVVVTAVTAYNAPEDKPFWDATPIGETSIGVANEKALEVFVPGQQYFVDFTAVDAIQ
jgi:hypothetical protein